MRRSSSLASFLFIAMLTACSAAQVQTGLATAATVCQAGAGVVLDGVPVGGACAGIVGLIQAIVNMKFSATSGVKYALRAVPPGSDVDLYLGAHTDANKVGHLHPDLAKDVQTALDAITGQPGFLCHVVKS